MERYPRPMPPGSRTFREATGLCIEDFMTLGFGLWAPLCAWLPGKPLIVDFRDAHGIDEGMVDRFFQVIAQDLGWFSAELVNHGPWDFVRFETTPVTRTETGRLALDQAFLASGHGGAPSLALDDHLREMSDPERLLWTSAYGAFLQQRYRSLA